MQDFKTLAEVYRHVDEVLVIDLLSHAYSLSDELLDSLIEPPAGLYLPGNTEPLFVSGKKYYRRNELNKHGRNSVSYNVFDSKTLLKAKDDIVDENGKLVMKWENVLTISRFLKSEPSIPVTAVRMAASMVQRYLHTLCRRVNHPATNTRIESLVKREEQDRIDRDEYMIAFDHLTNEVANFVNKDHWCVYFHILKGTTMIVEKGLDWRIIQYYENQFREEDEMELHR
jgi:hypothetical protein